MNSAKITTKFNIVDVLAHPETYIDEYSDTEILTIPDEEAVGGILRFLVGVEDGQYYIVVEDDYSADDIYPQNDETLMQAFIRALNDNLMAGAGVDVFVTEPLPESHPYLRMKHPERMRLSPHIAWASIEARDRLIGIMAENIQKGW